MREAPTERSNHYAARKGLASADKWLWVVELRSICLMIQFFAQFLCAAAAISAQQKALPE
jgi:hypothetical protein